MRRGGSSSHSSNTRLTCTVVTSYRLNLRGRLRAGQHVGLYAYRLAEASRWDIARLYCHRCAPDRLVGPTLGAAEVLMTGTLGTVSYPARQSHRLCVAEVLTRRVSPPTEGTRP